MTLSISKEIDMRQDNEENLVEKKKFNNFIYI